MNTKYLKLALAVAIIFSLFGCASHVFMTIFWFSTVPPAQRFNFAVREQLWDGLQYALVAILTGISLRGLRKLEPKSAEAYYERGRAFRCDGAYAKAIADYSDAIRLNPDYALAYNNRAYAHRQLGNFKTSIADCDQAIRANPKLVAAYHNRGLSYRELGEYDKAIDDYSHALQLDPKFALVYYNRGVAYAYKGDHENASADYGKAIQLDPQIALNRANRGLDHFKERNYKKALADYRHAIQLDPKCTVAYNHLAWLFAICPEAIFRDGKQAVELATKACELSEWKNPHFTSTLAAAYAEAGDFDNAVKWEKRYLDTPNLNANDAADAKNRLTHYLARKPYHAT